MLRLMDCAREEQRRRVKTADAGMVDGAKILIVMLESLETASYLAGCKRMFCKAAWNEGDALHESVVQSKGKRVERVSCARDTGKRERRVRDVVRAVKWKVRVNIRLKRSMGNGEQVFKGKNT